MRCRCLTDDICTVWDCNTAGIAFFIRKDFCRTIFTDYHWRCGRKIIVSIFFNAQRGYQVSGKSGTRKQICVCLSIIRSFNNLERLFHYLLLGSTFPFYRSHQIAFITAHQVIFIFICQIPCRRSNFFYIVAAKIQIIHRCLTMFIRCQRCHFFSCLIDHTRCPVRMHNILTGIQAIDSIFQCRIPLRHCLIRLCILFMQRNLCINTFIGKGMGERNHRFTIIGIRKGKGIYILRVP